MEDIFLEELIISSIEAGDWDEDDPEDEDLCPDCGETLDDCDCDLIESDE